MCHMHFIVLVLLAFKSQTDIVISSAVVVTSFISVLNKMWKNINVQIASVIPFFFQSRRNNAPFLLMPQHIMALIVATWGLSALLHVACVVDMCVQPNMLRTKGLKSSLEMITPDTLACAAVSGNFSRKDQTSMKFEKTC